MNVLRLYTHWLPLLFFGLLALLGVWIVRGDLLPSVHPDYLSTKQQFLLTALALFVAALFAGARIPYFLEGHLHHLVGPIVYDDTWHFQEINSLVNSPRYPAHCSLIPDRYFSLYYAPWMLIAALYLAIPIAGFTIKAAFALGCAIYQVLICLTLLHIGIAKARGRTHLYWAIYLVAAWAGVESFFSLVYYLRRDSWWLRVLSTPIHLPLFGAGMVWAIHHMSAAVAVILCWHIWETARSARWKTTLCCSLLISFTFYGSIFVFLGALPIGTFVVCRTLRDRWKTTLAVVCLSTAMIWPLLWLYLGKTGDVRFLFPFIMSVKALFPFAPDILAISGWSGARFLGGMWLAFILFLVFLCVNYLPYVFALACFGKRLNRSNRLLVLISIAFLISTYFVGFQEGDNYASRGYLVPILVLSWICAGLLPSIRIRSWVTVLLILGAFGSIHECIQTYKRTIYISRHSQAGKYDAEILAINRDRREKAIVADDLRNTPGLIYDVDKFIAGGKIHLVTADRQLVCGGPRGPWRWQRIDRESGK